MSAVNTSVDKPRRSRARKGKTSDARRSALIAVAARHFRDKGFDATTTRDIAGAIGMQSGSPFYHFKSKNALLFAVMEEGMAAAQRSQDAVLAVLPGDVSARETLYALVLNHLCVLWLPGNDFVAVMLHEWRSITAAQRKKIQMLKDAYEEPWRQVLEALHAEGRLGTNASLARSMLFGVLHGTLRWFSARGPLTIEQLAQECVNAMVAEHPSAAARAAGAEESFHLADILSRTAHPQAASRMRKGVAQSKTSAPRAKVRATLRVVRGKAG